MKETSNSSDGRDTPEERVDPKKTLTPERYRVMVECGTEPPFRNAYWDEHREGIYVDAMDGTPLFASSSKFDSGSGWPSFTRPIDESSILESEDASHGMIRTEIKSSSSGGHLGHVFNDGPGPGELRYCVNSASLKFVPKEDLEREGYSRFLELFS